MAPVKKNRRAVNCLILRVGESDGYGMKRKSIQKLASRNRKYDLFASRKVDVAYLADEYLFVYFLSFINHLHIRKDTITLIFKEKPTSTFLRVIDRLGFKVGRSSSLFFSNSFRNIFVFPSTDTLYPLAEFLVHKKCESLYLGNDGFRNVGYVPENAAQRVISVSFGLTNPDNVKHLVALGSKSSIVIDVPSQLYVEALQIIQGELAVVNEDSPADLVGYRRSDLLFLYRAGWLEDIKRVIEALHPVMSELGIRRIIFRGPRDPNNRVTEKSLLETIVSTLGTTFETIGWEEFISPLESDDFFSNPEMISLRPQIGCPGAIFCFEGTTSLTFFQMCQRQNLKIIDLDHLLSKSELFGASEYLPKVQQAAFIRELRYQKFKFVNSKLLDRPEFMSEITALATNRLVRLGKIYGWLPSRLRFLLRNFIGRTILGSCLVRMLIRLKGMAQKR